MQIESMIDHAQRMATVDRSGPGPYPVIELDYNLIPGVPSAEQPAVNLAALCALYIKCEEAAPGHYLENRFKNKN